MNNEQLLSILRSILKIGGTLLTAYGYVSDQQWLTITSAIVAIAPMIWDLFVHTQGNAVAVVDALAKDPLSPVKGVILEPTPEGRSLAASLPGLTTVPAGTAAAQSIAAPRTGF